jgi:predicted signal transduction protein with EAL and GGDEF domain
VQRYDRQLAVAFLDLDRFKQINDTLGATGRDSAQVKAIWSRILFTGRSVLPKQLPDSEAVKKAVAANPKAVGYIEKSAVDASVKVASPLD